MRITFLFLGVILVVASCSTDNTNSTTYSVDSLTNCKTENFEEFESSGLALLMRGMANDLQHVRDLLEANQTVNDSVLGNYAAIKSVDKTDPSINGEIFDAMADAFLNNYANARQKGMNKDDFNLLIQSCLTCHEQFCPGPIVRIKKLKL